DGLDEAGIEWAFVVSHLGPHVLLGRVKTDDGVQPDRYHWSDTSKPNSWLFGFDEDEVATSVAGFAILPPDVGHETPHILAIEPLRDFAVIYTNWSAWQLQFVGAPFIFVR